MDIILAKNSNLCVAVDVKTIEKALQIIDLIGPHVCMIKTQSERWSNFSDEHRRVLNQLKQRHNFLIFEDRKLYDLPDTIAAYYEERHVSYANFVTVDPSDDAFKALEQVIKEANIPDGELRGFIGLCEFSYRKLKPEDIAERYGCVERNSHVCCGIIAQSLDVKDPCNIFKASPGVHLSESGERGQNYNSPSKVIEAGADVIIVGRGIVSAPIEKMVEMANRYKEASWQAYLEDLEKKDSK